MRIVFMGTPDFAVPTLTRLVHDGHDVVGVFTKVDKPKGRGYQLQASPVKEEALRLGIPVFQPTTFKDGTALETLRTLAPDVIVVVAYGKILPQAVLDLPPYGCINVHGSLLPKYRGAAPIQWAVLNGDAVSGVTVMQMDAGVDTGDMLLTRTTAIGENETSGELYDRLREMGADACAEALTALQAGTLHPAPQPDGASYAPMLSKELSAVDWSRPAAEIHNQIRGLSPWPVAAAMLHGKRLKLHASRRSDLSAGSAAPGTVLSERPLVIACGGGTALELTEIQYEGSRRMAAADFVCGHPMPVGSKLDD